MALDVTLPKPGLDIREKGRSVTGEPIALDRRLFMQLLAFGDAREIDPLVQTLETAGIAGVLYVDMNDPYGVALLTFDERPDHFIETVRPVLRTEAFRALTPKPEYTMTGRTYAIGYESDLEEALIERPRRYVTNPEWPWAIWYPVRRAGRFETLPTEEQRKMLMEHGGIGHAFGRADYAHDIRLACHGLGKADNDFIVGLVGKELHPLSTLIQRMRKTRQTSEFLESLGPFFTGKAVWHAHPSE